MQFPQPSPQLRGSMLTPGGVSMSAAVGRQCPVTLLFLNQNEKTQANTANWLTEVYTGSAVIHCELYFPLTQETCSVDDQRAVYVQHRKNYRGLDAQDWEGLDLYLSAEQYAGLRAFCERERNAPLDKEAICWFCLPAGCFASAQPISSSSSSSSSQPTRRRWLCSRLIAAGLKHVGVFDWKLDVDSVTPSLLLQLTLKLQPAYVVHPVNL